jgi:hypothetical protein
MTELEYRLQKEREEAYRVTVAAAGNRKPPAEQPRVDHDKVAQALREAWAPKKEPK